MKFIVTLIFILTVKHIKSENGENTSLNSTTSPLETNSPSPSSAENLTHSAPPSTTPNYTSYSPTQSTSTVNTSKVTVLDLSPPPSIPTRHRPSSDPVVSIIPTLKSTSTASMPTPLTPSLQNSSLADEYHRTSHSSERKNVPDEIDDVRLPRYSLYLIGFSMLLMFLVILYLIFTLQKTRTKSVLYETFKRQDSSVSGKIDLKRQHSNEKSPVTRLVTIPTIECEGVKIEEPVFQLTCARDLNQNATSTSTLNKYENKTSPVIRTHKHPDYLGPEKMRMICKEALEKKLQNNSGNKGLHELLKEIDDIEKRPNNYNKSLFREKSASTPQLDIMDVYDTLPAPVPTNELNEAKLLDESYSNSAIDKIEEPPTTTEIDKLEDKSKYDDEEVEYDDIPLYDCPPTAKLNKIIIEDNQYLLPICSATSNPSLDPSYINAKNSNFIL